MKRPQLVSQGTLNRVLQAAEHAWHRRDFQECIDQLERAVRLNPANTNVLLQLGRIQGLRYNYASADAHFERASRLSPQKTETLTAAALMAFDFADTGLAEKYFNRAIQQTDTRAETFVRFAELYERLHRFEDASQLIDRALEINPRCPSACLVSARLSRQAGRIEEAEKKLQPVFADNDRDLRVRGYYELGMILDRSGRYEQAMAAFLEAKSLLRTEAAPLLHQLRSFRSHWMEMQRNISPEIFQRWFDSTSLQPPHRIAFLGGYPRSGTTLLEQVLDAHPDVVSAEETTLFNDDVYTPLTNKFPPESPMLHVLESANPVLLKQLRGQYFQIIEKHIGTPVGSRLLIDKNPSLNILIPAFIRVFPEIRLLVALRDPRDVCLSCFMQAHLPLSKGSVSYLTLEGTVEAYSCVMNFWRTIAPMIEGHYLQVRYEDMVQDLGSVSKRVLEFLKVPWDERVLRFNEHAQNKIVRSPTYADVAKPIFTRAVGRWQKYEKYFEPHLSKLEPFLKAFGYSE